MFFTFYFHLPLFLVTYIDEDENEILELSSNKTFLVMLKIPEECVTEKELPHLLTKRVMGLYAWFTEFKQLECGFCYNSSHRATE